MKVGWTHAFEGQDAARLDKGTSVEGMRDHMKGPAP